MAEVSLHKLNKKFDLTHVVKDVDLEIRDKEFMVFVGPSGCGKTTTLRMIAGLEAVSSGDIRIENTLVNQVPPMDRDIAMVFQNYALYPHMSVASNMAFGLKMRKFPKDEIQSRIKRAATILGIENLLARKPRQLSGGQRQRVALGRAIVRQPKAFLMDEPLGTLDAEFRELMCVELRKLHERLKTTTVFVTHDQNEAMALADHIVVMNKGEILQADDPLGIYNFPSCVFVARFIGRPPMNLLPVDGAVSPGIDQVKVGGAVVPVPALQARAARALLGVRPEHVRLAAPGEGLRAVITHVEYFGSHWIAGLRSAAGMLKAVVDKAVRPREGDEVGLVFETQRVVMFDADSELLLASAATATHRPRMLHG